MIRCFRVGLVLLACACSPTVEAGLIPWVYNSIFGTGPCLLGGCGSGYGYGAYRYGAPISYAPSYGYVGYGVPSGYYGTPSNCTSCGYGPAYSSYGHVANYGYIANYGYANYGSGYISSGCCGVGSCCGVSTGCDTGCCGVSGTIGCGSCGTGVVSPAGTTGSGLKAVPDTAPSTYSPPRTPTIPRGRGQGGRTDPDSGVPGNDGNYQPPTTPQDPPAEIDPNDPSIRSTELEGPEPVTQQVVFKIPSATRSLRRTLIEPLPSSLMVARTRAPRTSPESATTQVASK